MLYEIGDPCPLCGVGLVRREPELHTYRGVFCLTKEHGSIHFQYWMQPLWTEKSMNRSIDANVFRLYVDRYEIVYFDHYDDDMIVYDLLAEYNLGFPSCGLTLPPIPFHELRTKLRILTAYQ